MNRFSHKRAAPIMAAVLLSCSAAIPAASINVSVLNAYQEGTTAHVHMGHVVDARTGFNKLSAEGAFTARCNRSEILPASGRNQQSDWAVFGGIALTVSVPENLPASVYMSGFTSLPRGTTVDCNYEWSASATDVGYNVGGQVIGGGQTSQSGTQPFTMRVPSRGGGEYTTCIP
jgi:hypothetical protein